VNYQLEKEKWRGWYAGTIHIAGKTIIDAYEGGMIQSSLLSLQRRKPTITIRALKATPWCNLNPNLSLL